jgi:hypothetical protein
LYFVQFSWVFNRMHTVTKVVGVFVRFRAAPSLTEGAPVPLLYSQRTTVKVKVVLQPMRSQIWRQLALRSRSEEALRFRHLDSLGLKFACEPVRCRPPHTPPFTHRLAGCRPQLKPPERVTLRRSPWLAEKQ